MKSDKKNTQITKNRYEIRYEFWRRDFPFEEEARFALDLNKSDLSYKVTIEIKI